MYDMTGEDNPQGMPGAGHGGFHGFPGGGAGINIEDLMRGFGMGGGFGGPGAGAGHQRFGGGGRFHQQQRRQQSQGQRTYSFSFGGGMPNGMRF